MTDICRFEWDGRADERPAAPESTRERFEELKKRVGGEGYFLFLVMSSKVKHKGTNRKDKDTYHSQESPI